MTYMTKTEWVFNDPNFMKCSKVVERSIETGIKKKNGKFSNKDVWKIINRRIKRKRINPTSTIGICNCPDDILCDHRKKYLLEVLGNV